MATMLTLLRRYLVMAALLFWLGGFTFYATVVVHVGGRVYSHLDQGFITRHVVDYLHLAAAAALPALAWDLACDPSRWRKWLRLALLVILAATLGWLAWQTVQVDQHLDPEQFSLRDRAAFYVEHRRYLFGVTVQWIAGLASVALMLPAWRAEDQRRAPLP